MSASPSMSDQDWVDLSDSMELHPPHRRRHNDPPTTGGAGDAIMGGSSSNDPPRSGDLAAGRRDTASQSETEVPGPSMEEAHNLADKALVAASMVSPPPPQASPQASPGASPSAALEAAQEAAPAGGASAADDDTEMGASFRTGASEQAPLVLPGVLPAGAGPAGAASPATGGAASTDDAPGRADSAAGAGGPGDGPGHEDDPAAGLPPPAARQHRPSPTPKFRVGSAKNGFNYRSSRFRVRGHVVWQCSRGSGDHPNNVFWLYRVATGQWMVVEAPANTLNPVANGTPVFRTTGRDIEDISAATNALSWQWWDEAAGDWAGSMAFPTVLLPEEQG